MLIELNVTDHFKPDSFSDVYQRGQDSMTTLRANLAKYYVNGARSDLTWDIIKKASTLNDQGS